MRRERSFLSTLVSTFKTLSCLFIIIFLPLTFLYYLDSYLLLATKQHILDTAIMAIFLALLAFLGAVIAGIIYFIFSLFLKKETAAKITIVFFSLIGIAVAVYEFIKTTKLWFIKVFPGIGSNLSIVDIVVILGAIAVAVYVLIRREKVWPRLREERNKWFKVVVALVGVSIIIFAGQVSYTFWFDAQGNKAVGGLQEASTIKHRPNIILITFDTLTAEDMSLYGYKLKTTPNLDAFARESYYFKNMYANGNWTRPSIASILTATYPSTHRMIHYGLQNCFLPFEIKNKDIAALLKTEGYTTAAIVSNLEAAHPYTNDTFRSFDFLPFHTNAAGYREYVAPNLLPDNLTFFLLKVGSTAHMWINNLISSYFGFYKALSYPLEQSKWNTQAGAPAEITFDLASRYLQESKSPFFLWIHLYPPHLPYLPKKQFMKKFLDEPILTTASEQLFINGISEKSFYPEKIQPTISKLRLRYDELILDADNAFGLFLKQIRNDGYLDTSIVLVSADHGESFERGYVLHGGPMLYNNLIRIPLIVHLPKQTTPGIILQPMEQVDIAPTILDLLNMRIPSWMEGESLRTSFDKKTTSRKAKFSMQLDENSVSGKIKKGVIAVIRDDYKFIYNLTTQKSELYNLAIDPQESRNLTSTDRERAASMKQLITDKLAQVNKK